MQAGRADADAVGARDLGRVEGVHAVGTQQEAHAEAHGLLHAAVPLAQDVAVGLSRCEAVQFHRAGEQRGEVADHAVAAGDVQRDLAAGVRRHRETGGGGAGGRVGHQAGGVVELVALGAEVAAVDVDGLVAGRAGAVVLELVAVDQAGLAVDVGAAGDLVEHLARVGGHRVRGHEPERSILVGGRVGARDGLPELAVHHDGVVRGPQPALGLGADEAQHALVAPALGGHAGRASGAADLDLDGEVVVDEQRLLPGLHDLGGGVAVARGLDHVAADVEQAAQQRDRARGRAALHAGDRAAGGAHLRQVEHEDLVALAAEGHRLQQLDRLGPALAAVGDGVHHGTLRRGVHARQQLGGEERLQLRAVRLGQGRGRGAPGEHAQLDAEAAHRLGVGRVVAVRGIEVQQQGRREGPVDVDQLVVVGAADARAVEQEVELGEGGDRRRAVGEHLHVAPGLAGVAVLQVAAGGEQRAGGDGVAQARLLGVAGPGGGGGQHRRHHGQRGRQRVRAQRRGPGRLGAQGVGAHQRQVALRHAVGDAAEALLVLGAEHGAPPHRDPHAAVEQARGQRGLAESGGCVRLADHPAAVLVRRIALEGSVHIACSGQISPLP